MIARANNCYHHWNQLELFDMLYLDCLKGINHAYVWSGTDIYLTCVALTALSGRNGYGLWNSYVLNTCL